MLVLNLQAKNNLALWVQRPYIGLAKIFLIGDSPDLCRAGDAVYPAASLAQSRPDSQFRCREPRGFDESPNGLSSNRIPVSMTTSTWALCRSAQ